MLNNVFKLHLKFSLINLEELRLSKKKYCNKKMNELQTLLSSTKKSWKDRRIRYLKDILKKICE